MPITGVAGWRDIRRPSPYYCPMANKRSNLMQFLTTEKAAFDELDAALSEVARQYQEQLAIVRQTGRLYEDIARKVEVLRKATAGAFR